MKKVLRQINDPRAENVHPALLGAINGIGWGWQFTGDPKDKQGKEDQMKQKLEWYEQVLKILPGLKDGGIRLFIMFVAWLLDELKPHATETTSTALSSVRQLLASSSSNPLPTALRADEVLKTTLAARTETTVMVIEASENEPKGKWLNKLPALLASCDATIQRRIAETVYYAAEAILYTSQTPLAVRGASAGFLERDQSCQSAYSMVSEAAQVAAIAAKKRALPEAVDAWERRSQAGKFRAGGANKNNITLQALEQIREQAAEFARQGTKLLECLAQKALIEGQ